MDPIIRAYQKRACPDINQQVADGLAYHQLKDAKDQCDAYLKSLSMDWPEGLTMDGPSRVLLPEEALKVMIRRGHTPGRTGPETIDVARSNLIVVEYSFSYQGVKLRPRHSYIPYVGLGNELYLGGTRWILHTVVSDRIVSVQSNSVFLRPSRAKIIVKRLTHAYLANYQMCETYVAYGKIHNEQPDKKTNQLRDVRAETTLVHYLICRYGLVEAFKKASGADIIVTTLDEFNPKDYPMEDYLVAQSTGSMPKGYRNYYEPTKLVVVVPRSQVNDMVFNMLAGFYYVVDHYPNLLKIDTVFQTDRWMQTLGRILRGNDANLGKVMMGMTRHFSSLESYVDQATAIRLKQRFPEVNDFFELLIHVVKHMNEWIRDSDDLTGTLWGKELVTFPYILSDWIAMCNRLSFKINAPTNLEVRPETLDKYVFKSFTPGAIYKLSHGHGEVSTDAVPGDNMLIKQTSVAIAQGSTTDHRDRVPADSPVMKMHASVMTVGHALFPSKPDPRGGYRLNPYVRFDETYQVLRETGNAVVDAHITALDEFLKRSPKNYQYAPQAILEDDEDTIA